MKKGRELTVKHSFIDSVHILFLLYMARIDRAQRGYPNDFGI